MYTVRVYLHIIMRCEMKWRAKHYLRHHEMTLVSDHEGVTYPLGMKDLFQIHSFIKFFSLYWYVFLNKENNYSKIIFLWYPEISCSVMMKHISQVLVGFGKCRHISNKLVRNHIPADSHGSWEIKNNKKGLQLQVFYCDILLQYPFM